MTTSRRVHFSDEFFGRLDALLPEERGADGTPSVSDFSWVRGTEDQGSTRSRHAHGHDADFAAGRPRVHQRGAAVRGLSRI